MLYIGVVGLTTATVTILFTYFILCAEEYRWHWRAFLVSEFGAIYLIVLTLCSFRRGAEALSGCWSMAFSTGHHDCPSTRSPVLFYI
jgi:Endomembrane protein 70